MTREEAIRALDELAQWDSAGDPILPDDMGEAVRYALRVLRMDETMERLEKERAK